MSTNRQKGMPLCSNNSPISWSSKKQTCVALSTMEAEYIACSASVQEVVEKVLAASRYSHSCLSPMLNGGIRE